MQWPLKLGIEHAFRTFLSADLSVHSELFPQHLFIICPPVLGGDVTATHCPHADFPLLVRLPAGGIILSSDLASKGEMHDKFFPEPADVFVLGNMSALMDADAFAEDALLYLEFQMTRLAGGKMFACFAELRQVAGRSSSEVRSATDRHLLTRPPVEFDIQLETRNETTGAGCTSRKVSEAVGC